MKLKEKRRNSRLWFLVSTANKEYLNQTRAVSNSNEYQPVLGLSHSPSPSLNRKPLLYLYYSVLSIGLFLRLVKKIFEAILEKSKLSSTDFKGDKLYLLSAENSPLPRLLERAGLNTDDGYWLCPFKCHPSSLPSEKLLFSLSIIPTRYIVYSAFDIIRVFFYLLKKKGIVQVFRVNGGYQWFLYYWTLQMINPDVKIYFHQQGDQMVTCIDNSPQKLKYHLQHGTILYRSPFSYLKYPLFNYLKEYDCWTENWPYKMSNVEKTFVFSEKEYVAECSAIFKNKPKYEVVGYNLRTSDLMQLDVDKKTILIVAFYRAYSVVEEQLLMKLQDLDVLVYLKNHPTVSPDSYDSLRNKYKFTFINGPVFPKVDLVFSYGSTLALEYEELGIEVIYFDSMPVDDVIELAKRKLKVKDLS